MPKSTALIVGASRGLGLALAAEYLTRDWHVIATVRGSGRTALHDLATKHHMLEVETLDVTDQATIEALRRKLEGRSIDLLFVNAGISNGPAETVGAVSTEMFTTLMLTNTLGPMRVIEHFQALVPAGGVIGAMSSGLGSVANNETGGWEVYRASKAALNTLMRSFAARTSHAGRTLLVIAPGWVRTDMGGPNASLGIEQSIPGVVDTITAQTGTAGLHYLDYRGETVPW